MGAFTYDSKAKTFTFFEDEDVLQVFEFLVERTNDRVAPRRKTRSSKKNLKHENAEFVEILGALNDAGGVLKSRDVARAINLDEPRGLGQRKVKYERLLSDHGLAWSDVIVRRKTSDGNVWNRGPKFEIALEKFRVASGQLPTDHSVAEQTGTVEITGHNDLFAKVNTSDREVGA